MERKYVVQLATRRGWSEACAQGYADGEEYRNRGERPPKVALLGMSRYSAGFRAGFYALPVVDPAANDAHTSALSPHRQSRP